MARFLVRPVFWRDADGKLQRLTLLTGEGVQIAFAHRPRASANRLAEWLSLRAVDYGDVEIGAAELITQAEGDRLSKDAR